MTEFVAPVCYNGGMAGKPYAKHICGPAEDATGPSGAHYRWHLRHRTPTCGKAKREFAWKSKEKRLGRSIPDYAPPTLLEFECGSEEAAEGPSNRHYDWHLRRNTAPCGKARREASWSCAERRAGHPLPDWKPRYNLKGHICEDAVAAQTASRAHYDWHHYWDTPPCGKATAEFAWWTLEKKRGYAIPDYDAETRMGTDWDAPTTVYQHTFIDGDRYYGISSNPEYRWQQQKWETSPLGDKLRSGAMFITEVLCVAPNRRMAMEVERMAIKSGNPWGRLLNRIHNEEAADVH